MPWASLLDLGFNSLPFPSPHAGECYPWIVQLPVAVVSLDFRGVPGAAIGNQTLNLIAKHGFPAGKVLGAGVIDGRSVWADTGALQGVKAMTWRWLLRCD